jgi:hypothetical protein
MYRIALAVATIGLTAAALAPSLRADEWDKRTIMTINEPIQVPGKVLPPGKYVLKLMDSQSDRHIVQIFNADESQLQTTILAIPNYRLRVTGKTQFQFWETPPGQPKALRAWFYPGDNFGQEFAYPKNMATELSAQNRAPVPTTYAEKESDLSTAKVETTQPPQQEVAQNTPPPAPQAAEPTPAPENEANRAAAPEPAPAPAPAPQSLPKTGSVYPLIGLTGLLSLGLFGVLRLARVS